MDTVAGGSLQRGRRRIEVARGRDGSAITYDRWGRGAGRALGADAVRPLRELVAERERLDGRIRVAVQELRQAGASWSVVGDALGVTRSAAQKRYGVDELQL